jgi:hypothetical protein
MGCQNPEKCREKAARHQERMAWAVPIGETYLEDLQARIDTIEIAFSKHFLRERSFERVLSRKEILEVLKHGWVIEFYYHDKKACVLGYTSDYRPIHVYIEFRDVPVVITAYNPRSKSWRWNKSLDERNCFCK